MLRGLFLDAGTGGTGTAAGATAQTAAQTGDAATGQNTGTPQATGTVEPQLPQSATQQSEDTKTGEKKPSEKTFTQAELDFIIQERLKRAKQDGPDEEQMKAFKAWQDDQKTEQQKVNDELKAAQKAAADAKKQLEQMQQHEAVRKLGIADEFVGYVHYEATNRSAVKNITFDEALVSFVNESADKYKSTATRTVTVDTDTKPKSQDPLPFSLSFTGVRPKPGQTT
jgi:hypothetical protein